MSIMEIGGKSYKVGDVPFTDENLDLFEMALDEGVPKGFAKGMRRLIHESLIDGNGEEVAAEAMKALKMNFGPESDMVRAFRAVVKRIQGE